MNASPEFSLGAEFADQSKLIELFDTVHRRVSTMGQHRPMRANVDRLESGMPVLHNFDIENDMFGRSTMSIPGERVWEHCEDVATLFDVCPDGEVTVEYVPAYVLVNEPDQIGAPLLPITVPPQVTFTIPKETESVYAEETIRLVRMSLGQQIIINTDRDTVLQKRFMDMLLAAPEARDETPETTVRVQHMEEQYDMLSRNEVGKLMLMVEKASRGWSC